MYSSLEYLVVDISKQQSVLESIERLLHLAGLELDPRLSVFVIATLDSKIVACAGIDRDIIKCVAIDPDYRGNNINLGLLEYTIKYANEHGQFHLFLYTKPENKIFFRSCGFYPIVEVPDLVILMENTPIGIKRYCQQLSLEKKPGNKIGSIVMNANPFTKGHQYLAETAAAECDWLHIFVVNEDASMFSFADRFELVKAGVSHLKNVSVHASSSYIISKATFPSYFLKEQAKIDKAYMGIDLLIFRNYIAPALNITCRFVGTEPTSEVTNAYNEAMAYWLQDSQVSSMPVIPLIVLERIKENNFAISASRVRALLENQCYDEIKALVPPTTWTYLQNKYM